MVSTVNKYLVPTACLRSAFQCCSSGRSNRATLSTAGSRISIAFMYQHQDWVLSKNKEKIIVHLTYWSNQVPCNGQTCLIASCVTFVMATTERLYRAFLASVQWAQVETDKSPRYQSTQYLPAPSFPHLCSTYSPAQPALRVNSAAA